MSRTRILVTGDTGFIGSHLIARLVKQGYDVVGTSRLGIDLRDLHAVNRFFETERFSEVYHLAAHGARSQADAHHAIEVNTVATANLARAALHCGISRFLYMGSGFEYGSHPHPVDESTPLEPANLYAASKAAASVLLQYYARTEGLPLVILRPFSIYGPGETPPRLLIPWVCSQLSQAQPVELTAGTQIRDYIFIDDLIDAVMAARERALPGSIYNLGAGPDDAYPVRRIVETIAALAGRSLTLCRFGALSPTRPEPPYFVADIRRAAEELNWRPRTRLRDGLAQTLDWYSSPLQERAAS
jgi:nucleoside-diphosphate-sugar epimerase